MRRDTLVWLQRHGLTPQDGAVCFVPQAKAKVKVWRQLARDGQLVIVDDLSYNHESDSPTSTTSSCTSPSGLHASISVSNRSARSRRTQLQWTQLRVRPFRLLRRHQDALAAKRTARL